MDADPDPATAVDRIEEFLLFLRWVLPRLFYLAGEKISKRYFPVTNRVHRLREDAEDVGDTSQTVEAECTRAGVTDTYVIATPC